MINDGNQINNGIISYGSIKVSQNETIQTYKIQLTEKDRQLSEKDTQIYKLLELLSNK